MLVGREPAPVKIGSLLMPDVLDVLLHIREELVLAKEAGHMPYCWTNHGDPECDCHQMHIERAMARLDEYLKEA